MLPISSKLQPTSSVAPRGRRAMCLVLVLALGVAGACGDDDGTDASDGPAPQDAAEEEGAGGDDGSTCEGTDVRVTNLATGESATLTSAAATSSYDGGLYVAYAADYDLGPDDLTSFFPEVPEGNTAAVIQLTMFNATEDPAPIAPGTELEPFTPFDNLTFLVALITADEQYASADEASTEGSLVVTGVGQIFCAEVDYVDGDKEVRGTIQAPVIG